MTWPSGSLMCLLGCPALVALVHGGAPLDALRSRLMDVRSALASFAHSTILVFLGGFALAAALQRQCMDRLVALAMLPLLVLASAVLWMDEACQRFVQTHPPGTA